MYVYGCLHMFCDNYVFLFLLGALGTPRANYIMVWHFPKKWGNATMPQCQGLVLVQGTTVTVGRGRLMVASSSSFSSCNDCL